MDDEAKQSQPPICDTSRCTSTKHRLSSPASDGDASKLIRTAIERALVSRQNAKAERQRLSTGDASILDAVDTIVRTDISVPNSDQIRPNNLLAVINDAQEAPEASEFETKDPTPRRRPPIMERRSLLNEQISFLSTTTSSDGSSGPSSPVTQDYEQTELSEERRTDTPSWVSPAFSDISEHEVGHHRELNSSPANNIRLDLEALAIEQGDIPVSALSSPTYAQPSMSGMAVNTSLAHLSIVLKKKGSKQNSSLGSSSSFPQPLRTQTPTEDQETLHRSTTLPTKSSRRPTFLPLPQEEPKLSTSFTREGVLSTPFPGSGFNIQPIFSPSNQPRSAASNKIPSSRQQLPACKIPVILHDGRNRTSGIGKVELPPTRLEKAEEISEDDYHFVKDIIREYYRLRGNRVYISARTLKSVKIVFKSHSRDFYTPTLDLNSTSPDLSLNPASDRTEDSRAAAYIAMQRAVSRTASADASKRHLEESLSLLLKKPRIGRDSSACSSDLRKLISEVARPDKRGGPRGTLALEIVEGWDWFRIGIAVACVLLSSMIGTLLWILLGVNGMRLNVEGYHALIRHGVSMVGESPQILTAWGGPGSRLAGGVVLGLFILLTGWSWIGFWIGMSWLIN